MNDTASGSAVERSLFAALDALKRGDVAPWVEMFHEDGVMEFPYAPPGNPARLNGKGEIAGYMAAYPEHVAIKSVSRRGTYQSDGVLVVEFGAEGTAVPTGNAFKMDYVGVITHGGGKIRHYRDYWNPLVAIQAMGSPDAMLQTDGGAR